MEDNKYPGYPTYVNDHPLYRIWIGIKARCISGKDFKHYKGKGVTICEEWLKNSRAFIDWALTNGWRPGLTIERKDNDGDYCPENCTFISRKGQLLNTSRTIKVVYKGETRSLFSLCSERNLSEDTIKHRLDSGWSLDKALTTPIRKYHKEKPA